MCYKEVKHLPLMEDKSTRSDRSPVIVKFAKIAWKWMKRNETFVAGSSKRICRGIQPEFCPLNTKLQS